MVERLKQVRVGRLGWGLARRSNGDLCRYSDYVDLERQIAELRAELDCALIREGNEKHRAKIAHQNMNCEIRARAALASEQKL